MDTIKTLAGKFENYADLQRYCDAQYTSLKKAAERIKLLEDEVQTLKTALATTQLTSNGKVEVIDAPSEQIICEVQIARMKEIAMTRDLTLEETKRLDLLVKNLTLIKSNSIAIPAESYNLDFDKAELMAIASGPEPQPESD